MSLRPQMFIASYTAGPIWGRGTGDLPRFRRSIPGVGDEAELVRQQTEALLRQYEAQDKSATGEEVAPMWLEDTYAYCMQSRDAEALDVMFRHINTLLCEDQFSKCNDLLRAIDLQRLDTHLMIGLLSITLAASSILPFRSQLVSNIESRLRKLAPDRVERLLNGLR